MKITVGICELEKGKHGSPLIAYTRYILPGQCIHEVEAENGTEAKKIAIEEHRKKCMSDNAE